MALRDVCGIREVRVADMVRRSSCARCGYQGVSEARIRNAKLRGRVLSMTHPDLAAEVDVDRSGRTPDQIPTAGREKVWWTCPTADDHRWQAPPYSRTNPKQLSDARSALASATTTKNLAVKHPEIATELDTTRAGCRAEELLPGSSKVMPWTCRFDPSHQWEAKVRTRTSGRGRFGCRDMRRTAKQQTLW
jgi:hypothetical protein